MAYGSSSLLQNIATEDAAMTDATDEIKEGRKYTLSQSDLLLPGAVLSECSIPDSRNSDKGRDAVQTVWCSCVDTISKDQTQNHMSDLIRSFCHHAIERRYPTLEVCGGYGNSHTCTAPRSHDEDRGKIVAL